MSEHAPVLDAAAPRLDMVGISKRYGGVHALEDVSFRALAGEVHALCGENGAGKSTLMKILSGGITDYRGTIRLNGRETRFAEPRAAENAGIRIIHQELNLVPDLSAAANIFLGRERRGRLGLLNDRLMERLAGQLFDRLGAAIPPRARVGDLRIGDQQMVEIAKALAFDADILIMDEPTSALSDAEVSRLFRAIADLKRAGASVIYISHKMNEVFSIADRVSVLRDGRNVADALRSEIDPSRVVRWMVGREIAELRLDRHEAAGRPVLSVENLSLPSKPDSGRPSLRSLSFDVREGEIVGVAGLLGAGRTELLEALFGASPRQPTGSIRLDSAPVTFSGPDQAIEAGVALVTEDRKTLGLFDRMTVSENISVGRLRSLSKLGFINFAAERKRVSESIENLSIKTAGGRAAVTSLSGGNQQKCILARWLLIRPKVLLLDEPTRGIDVGAKAEIYALIRGLAEQGMAVLMTSSELPELLTVCDRILVLCEGRLTGEFSRSEAREELIMDAATRFLDRAGA